MPKSVDRGNIEDLKSVALKFVEVINAGDSERLIKLQSEDSTFIDVEGDVYRSRDGWQSYFSAIQTTKSMCNMS